MRNKEIVWGIILLSAGIIAGLATANIISGEYFLFIVSIGFIAAYIFSKRTLGLIIPGCIITATALFSVLERAYTGLEGEYFLILLGLAFMAIFFIHTNRINSGSWGGRYWPLFPGIGLVLLAGLVLAVEKNIFDIDPKYLNLITPFIIVVIGIWLLVGGLVKNNRNQ